MEVKEKLICIRAILNLTQQALAIELGVTFSTLNRWERGSEPSLKNRVMIDIYAKSHGIRFDEDSIITR